jgi:hypothetical protein
MTPKCGAQRDADAAPRSGADLDRALVDRNARIVVSPVKDAEGIDLRSPSVGVKGLCVASIAVCEDLVDSDVLSRFRLFDEFAIVIAPPSRDIAAEATPFVTRATARSWRHVIDTHFEDVARLSVLNGNRTSADVHPEAFASPTPEDRCINGASPPSVHALFGLGPQEHLLRCSIAPDHQFGIVGSVLRERFNLDGVPRSDLENWP